MYDNEYYLQCDRLIIDKIVVETEDKNRWGVTEGFVLLTYCMTEKVFCVTIQSTVYRICFLFDIAKKNYIMVDLCLEQQVILK